MHDYCTSVGFTVNNFLHKDMQLLGIQREYILFHLHMLSNENCKGRRGRQIIASNECKIKIIVRPAMYLKGYCLPIIMTRTANAQLWNYKECALHRY